jgi:hypothetical protein
VRWQKKHVFGSEAKLAGMGCQTLAFVGWHISFFFQSVIMLLLCRFFGLRTTFTGMKRAGLRSCFRIYRYKSLKRDETIKKQQKPACFMTRCCAYVAFILSQFCNQ